MFATELKIKGADLRPKGRTKSTKYLPLHFMPKRKRSSECTAILRYAGLTSNFASNVPDPYLGKLLGVNAVVNAVATGGGQVNSKTPLPRLIPFRNDPKAANM